MMTVVLLADLSLRYFKDIKIMVLDSTSETWNKSVNLDLFQDIKVYQHIDESNNIEIYQEPNSIIQFTSNNNEFQAIHKFDIDCDDLECFNKKLFDQKLF